MVETSDIASARARTLLWISASLLMVAALTEIFVFDSVATGAAIIAIASSLVAVATSQKKQDNG